MKLYINMSFKVTHIFINFVFSLLFRRGGLANSLYMPRWAVGSHSHEMISDFMSKFYSPANATVITSGLDADQSAEFASKVAANFGESQGQKHSLASKYVAGSFCAAFLDVDLCV